MTEQHEHRLTVKEPCPVESHEDATACFSGDATGTELNVVYSDGETLFAPLPILPLLACIKSGNLPLTLSPNAISSLLNDGVVPLPGSIFREMSVLGIGDQISYKHQKGKWQCTRQEISFPYFANHSREDQVPDSTRLMERLTRAVSQSLDGISSPLLMLSAGKDSTAIALALAKIGRRDVRCLTFAAGTEKDEDDYARSLCQQLGLKHARIEIPIGRPLDDHILIRYFEHAPFPCVDECQIPYVYALHCSGNADAVLDGSGNDVYMGHVPSRNDRRRDRLRIRNRRLTQALERWVPFGTRFDQLLRDPVEHCFVQGLFRRHEIRRIYHEAVFPDEFKEELLNAYHTLDVFDYRALVRGRHYDQGSCALKAQMACQAFGAKCLLPWCDADVIDYYFNLPQQQRFDKHTFTNKVLLRDMLRHEIDYPEQSLGKRYFQFDRASFFASNQRLVYDEILQCTYWNRAESERLLGRIYQRLPRNPRVGVALNSWFLLSGWLNHNRWLNQ